MKINYYRCNYDIISKYCDSFTTAAHAHEGVEIIYLKKGISHTFINGEEYEIHPGDLFVIFPDSLHYHKDSTNIKAVLNIFPTRTLPEFHGVFTKKTPKSPLIRNADTQVIKFLEDLAKYNNKYKPEAKRGILLAAVSMILENILLLDKKEGANGNLGAILKFCDEHYTEDITIESVAKELMISKSCVSHIFTHKLQTNFRDYINSLRLRYTLKLLKEDNLTITEIAYESGFSTIRTFNRAFKKKFDISPLQYKKRITQMNMCIDLNDYL